MISINNKKNCYTTVLYLNPSILNNWIYVTILTLWKELLWRTFSKFVGTWDFSTKTMHFFFFFDYQCTLMFNDYGEMISLRAVLSVECSWSGKTDSGIKRHGRPMGPSSSHFGWTGNAGFQSLEWRKAQTNNKVRKMFSKSGLQHLPN